MKERPILLYQHEVLAIIDGRQTQLRRVVDPQPTEIQLCLSCPYGVPGDRLWAQEEHVRWKEDYCDHDEDGIEDFEAAEYVRWRASPRIGWRNWLTEPSVNYFPDGEAITFLDESTPIVNAPMFSSPWISASMLPRWASRITLEVTDVRVERLNDISVADAMCEGIPVPAEFLGVSPDGMPIENPDADGYHPVDAFRELWGSFDSRWVWAVTFKLLENMS